MSCGPSTYYLVIAPNAGSCGLSLSSGGKLRTHGSYFYQGKEKCPRCWYAGSGPAIYRKISDLTAGGMN